MRKKKKSIILVLVVICLLLVFLPRNPFSSEEVLFYVERGEGSKEIALNLEEQGLIWWGPLFRVYVLIRGVSGKLQAGLYQLSSSMNMPALAGRFVQGDVAKEKITIIEGWNLRDMGFYFENKGMFQAEELWELAGFPAVDYTRATDLPLPLDFSEDYNFLKDKTIRTGLEGCLFPDTYEINAGASLEEIVRKMLDNFGDKTEDLEIDFNIITMASLLEKEVKSKEDREIVSGILWKRLQIGMPLQVDATLSYITGKKTTDISIEETQIDSPYNTYIYYGLPVGPICNPGLESILAALQPQDSPYLYYLSTPEGETIFSKTLDEHNIAKAKYLK